MPIGAPAHRALLELLTELFTGRECRLAAAMPFTPAMVDRIAGCADISERTATEQIKSRFVRILLDRFARRRSTRRRKTRRARG